MFKLNVSKYRHTNGKVDKRELWYPDVNTSGSGAATTFIKANGRWIGLNWQSTTGTVGIVPLKSFGKRKGETFLVHAHSSTLTDFEFNPFNENQLVTAGEDSTIKVWSIREAMQAGQNTLSTPTVTCVGHSKAVEAIAFNPSAENILASVGQDKTLRIWDLSNGEEKYQWTFDNVLYSISWNYDGSLLVATGKDNKNRIINPRTGESVQVGDGHQGVKPSRCVWLGNSPYVVTVGFSKMRERQLQIWDSSDLSKSIKSLTLDSSTGIINPIYDQDAQLLFISGSGDSTIRVFDLNTQFTKEPALTEIQNVPTDTPAKGLCAIPKRALDVMEVEIDRLLKATPNNIVPITFSMSRKSKSQFADDLFPNTISTKPALSSNEWLSGENKQPILMSLNPLDNPVNNFDDLEITSNQEPEKKMTFFVDDNSVETTTSNQVNEESSSTETKVESTSNESLSTSTNTSSPSSPIYSSASLQNENITRTGYVPKVVRSSKYRHIVGTAAQKNQFYTGLKINGSTSNTCIAVNREYVAVPYIGIGGPLAVIPLASKGRQLNIPCIEIGSQLCDFDLSQFNSSIIATGSEDSHVKIYKVPEGGLPKTGKNYTAVEADFVGHNRKVVSVNFHPTAEEVLISTGGDMVVKIWDLNSASEKLSFEGHTDMITSVDVNYTGDLFLTSSKDKKMRIFDPRANNLVSETTTHSGVKGAKSIWLGQTGNILSVGFNKQSDREFQLWDSRNLSNFMVDKQLDHLSGVITPFYDEDTGVVYLAGKGDATIRMFEINNEEPYVHHLTDYSASAPQVGVAKVSQKTIMDVKKCEISRFYKVTTDTIEPISMTVPRNRAEFFQDDIYPNTRSGEPAMSSSEWFDGMARECNMVSLKPEGMVPLSEAPPPPKKEEKNLASVVLDHTPTKDQISNSLLSKVQTQNAYSNWQQIQQLKNSVKKDDVFFEDPVSDSEWD